MTEKKKASPASVLVIVVIAIIVTLGGRWYYYVAFAESPFDEVGIGLNSMMPGPINEWGCSLLKARFEKTSIPPMGCGKDSHW